MVAVKQTKQKEGRFMEQQITELYCQVDDFCREYEAYARSHYLANGTSEEIIPKCAMSISEMMTIVIWFHPSNYRTFKWYYKNYVSTTLKPYFPKQLSYNRFVELMSSLVAPMLLYLNHCALGKCSGISFIDSTILAVCHNRRIYSHKVFAGMAKRGKSSTGWFFGFKLHLVINDMGEIISFALTPGNASDSNAKVMAHLTRDLMGRLFGDKGYLSKTLFDELFQRGITLITKLKKNMKNKLMLIPDKLLLRKRAVIESVNDFLKNICQIEHSRHRSPKNFLVNLLSGLAAYSIIPKKPSLRISGSLPSSSPF
jgi:IS5 family transposase